MSNVEKDDNRQVFDLRERILNGEHPRGEMFEHAKKAAPGTILEIHTPRRPVPLLKGLEEIGMDITVDEIEEGHVRVVALKI